MTGSAPRLPVFVPMFTELSSRGLKRAHIAVYGAVVAFDALRYVPTCMEIARAANLSAASEARDVRRFLLHLVDMQLLERVQYAHTLVRYRPIGPKMPVAHGWMSAKPANDNGG
jgi:hypothetical protein